MKEAKLVRSGRAESGRPGRPRSERARKAVIRSTLALLKRVGFHELRIEAVARHAGVGKATIYRWWPTKADLVIAAFADAVEPELRFAAAGPVSKSIHQQMKRWSVVFRSPMGTIVAGMIGAGQSKPEILRAFRRHWVEPRRMEARKLLRRALRQGEMRNGLDPDFILDLLYGPLYLRLLLKHASLHENFVNTVFAVLWPALAGTRSSSLASAGVLRNVSRMSWQSFGRQGSSPPKSSPRAEPNSCISGRTHDQKPRNKSDMLKV
ncbi:MAG: TetR/AcrR family transcriptional regulator [Acidobacteria bacterium]|nr:TetR/AcrR family transcriptional regulator [Acidobacteriota bacterium]